MFDRLLPQSFLIDGNRFYAENILPKYLIEGSTLYDLGGGSRPYVSTFEKERLSLRVKGIDISADELQLAPAGVYDDTEVADLTCYEGDGNADLVICQSTLEHVRDGNGALRAIATSLKSGGTAVIFVPCRNAWFARLNLALPEKFKKRLLYRIYPETNDGHHGFEAFYDKATPSKYRKMAAELGLTISYERTFWKSAYFQFFLPLYAFWRLYQITMRPIFGDDICETFAMVLKKPDVA